MSTRRCRALLDLGLGGRLLGLDRCRGRGTGGDLRGDLRGERALVAVVGGAQLAHGTSTSVDELTRRMTRCRPSRYWHDPWSCSDAAYKFNRRPAPCWSRRRRSGGLLALAAAALFGLSTPAAKAIVGNVAPLMLAGLLYLGSGLGLLLFRLLRGEGGVALKRGDLPWLAGAVLFGGGLGPALLMWGLVRTTGSAASLLLTLEGVFTALIAWIVFREPFNRRIGLGMA
eukprot:gene31814-42436_t